LVLRATLHDLVYVALFSDTASQWITEQYVVPRLRPHLMKRVEDHQRSGHRLLLLSGTPLPLLAAIGQELGIEHVVGTPLRLRNGRYTGASEPPVCQGANKVLRLERYLGETEEINWSESWAYADSLSDLPVLERVGHPVAIHPDPPLAALAKERGWEMIVEGEGLA